VGHCEQREVPEAANQDHVAAGMRIDALQMLFGDMVLVCGFGDLVKFALVADTVVQVPPAASNESRKYLFAKLGIAAEVDFSTCMALLTGQIDPSCHLMGEFALFYWFGGNEHAGDCVVSLGGYHPAYVYPSYYLSWARLFLTNAPRDVYRNFLGR